MYTCILACLQHYRGGIFVWRKYWGCKVHGKSAMTGIEWHHLWRLVHIYLVSSWPYKAIFQYSAGKLAIQQNICPCMHIFIDFDDYRRNSAKSLYTLMENLWLLEPALKACKNTAVCRNKASQIRQQVLFPILLSVGNLAPAFVSKSTQKQVGIVRQW